MRSDVPRRSCSSCYICTVRYVQLLTSACTPLTFVYAALKMMTATADQTVYRMSPRRDGRKYFTWEQSRASSRSPRRRSSSLPPPDRPSAAPICDVMASSRVGRLLRRRLTDVCRRRSRRRGRCCRDRPPTCKTDGSGPSTVPRRARSAAGCATTPQRDFVLDADVGPPPDAVTAVTRLTWPQPWRATWPTTTAARAGTSTIATTVARSSRHSTVTSTASLREQFVSFFQVSDNKLALKLFGNKNALEKEKLRHKAVGHWVIHPCSDFRFHNVYRPSQSIARHIVTI